MSLNTYGQFELRSKPGLSLKPSFTFLNMGISVLLQLS